MADRNQIKERKCRTCGTVVIATAKTIKDHEEECKKEHGTT